MTRTGNRWAGLGASLVLVGASAMTVLPASSARAAQLISACGPVYGDVQLAADISTTSQICLDVKVDGVTIDGANHRVTSSNLAVSIIDHSHVVVQRVVSNAGMQIYGEQADWNVVRNSQFGWVGIYMGDDNTVQANVLGKLVVWGMNNKPAQRETITGNFINGVITQAEGKVVTIRTGEDGTTEPDGSPHCASGGHTIANNWITGSAPQGTPTTTCFLFSCTTTQPPPPPEFFLLWFACGGQSTIVGNAMGASQLAGGLVLRDEADDNLILNNTILVGQGNEGALTIINGNTGYHNPRNNLFQENTFTAGTGRAAYFQAAAPQGNVFQNNVFAVNQGGTEVLRVRDGTGVTYVFDHNTFYHGGTGSLVVFRDLGSGSMRFGSNILDTQGTSVFGFDGSVSLGSYVGVDNLFWWSGASVGALQGWQSGTGQDLNSKVGNPAFVSPSTGDFHLTAQSPARGAGENGSDDGAFPYVPTSP
jgi:hypothetical protein